MRDSLLGQVYFKLPDSTRQGLHQAVRSPAFNQRREVVRLFDFLEKFAGENKKRRGLSRVSSAPSLTKPAAFAFIFSENQAERKVAPAYNDSKMRHLMSYALETLRQYLAWDEWRHDSRQVSLHLCRALKKHGLEATLEKEHERALATVEATPHRGADYFFYRYALELEAWEHSGAGQRSGAGNLKAVGDAFGAFVAINALRQGCAAVAQKAVAPKDLAIPYLHETLLFAEQGVFNGIPALETYYFSYKALTEPDNDQVFHLLKNRIENDGALFPDAELRDLYILAINFCIRRLNAGERQYIQEAFGLYRAGLNRKVFLENGYLARFTYRNILNLALALNEWDWALEYLHTFEPYLPPRERDNIFRYNLATYYFRRPDHDKALELLRQVEFRDTLYNFDARRMLLRIYYDRQEWQALESLLDSFVAYLQRHREAGYHREMYLNLVRFVKRLLHLGPDLVPARDKLRTDIEQTVHLAEREWLLEILGGVDRH